MKNHVRIVTATSLFDGHDASINIMRRLFQAGGAEVIHLGHNRSVKDIVSAAIQEDAHAIAISSYQGGHMEFFKYTIDLLREQGAGHIKVFGGGGGVIIHDEKSALEKYGVAAIYHPDDGRRLGLDGMIKDVLNQSDFDIFSTEPKIKSEGDKSERALARAITICENLKNEDRPSWMSDLIKRKKVFATCGGNNRDWWRRKELSDR
jgi:methylmalonyl-CoA mutase